MEASGNGSGDGAGQDGHQDDSGYLDDQGSFVNVLGDMGIDFGALSQVVVIPQGTVSTGPALLVISRIDAYLYEFVLRLPFLSASEADVTQASLAPFEGFPEVQRELTVNGRIMIVRWTAQDPNYLQAVFLAFIEDVFLIFQTMQFLRPLFACMS